MGGLVIPVYNKLVRDRIPEIIEKTGKTCRARILNEKEYIEEIRKKNTRRISRVRRSGNTGT